MNWSRAKTILIALLLAVNVFLLVTYVSRENEVRGDEMAVRAEVCKILSSQGIEVNEEAIPLDSVKISPAMLESSADMRKSAKALFGEVTESVGGDGTAYSGEGGNILFSNGSFSLVYESGRSVSDAEDAEELARTIASKLGISTAPRDFECYTRDGGYNVRIPQVFSGVHVFDCNVEFKISGSGSVIASGKFIGSGRLKSARGDVINTSALMLSFADGIAERGAEPLTVSEISLGYISKSPAAGHISLVPTIEFKTGNGVFYVNMQTGKFSEI